MIASTAEWATINGDDGDLSSRGSAKDCRCGPEFFKAGYPAVAKKRKGARFLEIRGNHRPTQCWFMPNGHPSVMRRQQ
jgi:hypothetical protein